MADRPVQTIKELARKVMAEYCHLSLDNMRDDGEKRIIKAMKENDLETLKELLKNPRYHRLGSKDLSILSVAVLKGHYTVGGEVIKFLIEKIDCDVRRSDAQGNTVLHLILWKKLAHYATPSDRNDRVCNGCEMKWHRLEILEILLSAYGSDRAALIDDIFSKADKYQMTPFLLACALECDVRVTRFLSLLDRSSIPISIDRFIGFQGDNVFHFLLDSTNYFLPSRVDTVRAAIEKIPFSDRLIDLKNDRGWTPLHQLFLGADGYGKDWKERKELANICFQNGASFETRDKNGTTYFELAVVELQNLSFVEVLLRAGVLTMWPRRSFLRLILRCRTLSKEKSIQMIEQLLSFGYDLQEDLFLYTIEERPMEFTTPEYAKLCDTTGMNPEILEALRGLRRSNKMLSLQRQCRNTIRRQLEAKADAAIASLTCIPPSVKSFLLVENEDTVLEITE